MATESMFGRPLVTNVYRSVLVEAMVASSLTDWEWCSADYAPYDFRHPDGTRLEVKQSAFRQTWASTNLPRPSWDIRPRTGHYEGTRWVPEPGRKADIYVFGLHLVADSTADHRDASQWRFHVVRTADLPPLKRLTATQAGTMCRAVPIVELASRVEECRLAVQS